MFEQYCKFCVRITRVYRWLRWPLAIGLLLFYAGECLLEYVKDICGIVRQRMVTLLPTRSMLRRTVSAALALVIVAGMLPTTALAIGEMPGARSEANSSGDVFLGGNYIEIGISKHGSFGTSRSPRTNQNWHPYSSSSGLGLTSDGDGWDVGSSPLTGDFFLPGTPEECWGLAYKYNGTRYEFFVRDRNGGLSSNNWKTEPRVEDMSDVESGLLMAKVTGVTGHDVEINIIYSFGVNDKFYKTEVEIVNNSGKEISDVRFVRSFDPDQDQQTKSTYETYNKVICNPVSSAPGGADNFAMVVARGAETMAGFFFLAFDNRARVSTRTEGLQPESAYASYLWDSAPAGSTVADSASVALTKPMISAGNKNGYIKVDAAIAVTFNLGSMANEATDALEYLSSLDPNVEDSLATILKLGVDYKNETLTGFSEEAAEYAITVGEEVWNVVVEEVSGTYRYYRYTLKKGGAELATGNIADGVPLQEEWWGKSLTLKRTDKDSNAQEIVTGSRPSAPRAPTIPDNEAHSSPDNVIEPDVTTTNNSVTIKATPGQEYKVGDGEWLTPDEDGTITVTDLAEGSWVTVYTRVAASASTPASVVSSVVVKLEDPLPLTVIPYVGWQDGQAHIPTFAFDVDDVDIAYTVSPAADYSNTPPSITEVGKHTVYYRASKPGYKTVYGQSEVNLALKVTYDSNGATSGAAPTDNTYYYPGDTVTLRSSGNMIRSGYVFDKWNTAPDGSGTPYLVGEAFSIPDNANDHMNYYATWKEIEKSDLTGTVNFNYAYDYPASNGDRQTGTQSPGERATKARITLLKNGNPVGTRVVTTDMPDNSDTASGTYTFEDMPLTDEYGNDVIYTVQAVALFNDGETVNDDYVAPISDYRLVTLDYSPGCFDAEWKVTINNPDGAYPIPDSIYVKVLYATEENGAYNVITQQAGGNGTECFKMTDGDVINYYGSYPVWKYQADVGGSYYHKFQIVGYKMNGTYVDISDENLIYTGEMVYTGSAASEVMALSYSKTLIPTVEVAGDIRMNYSYSYPTGSGQMQSGTQNVGERATKVRVTLLKNGTPVGNPVVVTANMFGNTASATYSFGRLEKYSSSGMNSYTIQVSALNAENAEVADYSVDISTFDATLTYSPECFDATWTVALEPGFEDIPSSVNVKVLYALTSDASLDGYEIISQQAENLGVECPAVVDGSGGVTYSGSYPVWKYQAGVGGSYYHKIQVVGYTINGVYYDVSYRDDLISDGAMYFNGSGASATMRLDLTPEIPAEEITVTGTILESDGVTGASNAKVELRKGSETIVSTMTDIYGHYTFVDILDGMYTIVITKEDVTVTKLVTVDSGTVSVDDIIMPSEQRNSVLDNSQAGAYAPDVGGLDEIAASVPLNGARSVEIKLTVTAKTAETAPEEDVSEIKKVASGKILELIDLTLTQHRDNELEPTDIGGSNTQLLKIVIPFVKGNKQNITVYRYHGSEVHTLTATPNSDGEYIEVGNSSITIHAMKFSTYAIGYTVPSSSGGGGGSYSPSYSITSPDTENGKVTISPKNASKGSTVTITATPDEGYQLAKLAVTDKDGKEIEVIANSDGKYTFKMPAGNVTVTAKFVLATNYSVCLKDETCPICDYTDASAAAWYHDGVHYCIDHSIMTGYGNGVFAPNGIVTRQQVWLTLARISGETPANVAEAKAWAIENGVSDGTNATMAVSRQQFITMLYRYAVNMGYDVSVGEETNILSYNDAFDIAEYAISAMQWGCGSGVMGGYTDGSLNPAATTTRAHLATFLQRFCVEIVK